ncbi:MAG: hypothetical protein AAB654_21875 [Acidobacteriota bacterium]
MIDAIPTQKLVKHLPRRASVKQIRRRPRQTFLNSIKRPVVLSVPQALGSGRHPRIGANNIYGEVMDPMRRERD